MTAAADAVGSAALDGVVNHLDAALRGARPALICYLPLGDPALPSGLADVYVEAGVDVLEIGLPVANPYVDGPTIRDSMQRSLRAGMTPTRAARETAALRERFPEQALVWMSYGPVFVPRRLVQLADRAGVDGVLFVEPARHFAALAAQFAERGVHLLHFLARELPAADVAAARASRGYVMLQGISGATGMGDPAQPLPDSAPLIETLRQAGVRTPVALGIGVTTPAQACQAIEMGADAVIVGSTVVQYALRGDQAVRTYLGELRAALS